MTIAVDPKNTQSATPISDADLKAKLGDQLKKRNAGFGAAKRPAASGMPASHSPSQQLVTAGTPARANKEPGIEATLRRTQLMREANDGPMPSWSKVTLQQNLLGLGIFAVIIAAIWGFYGASVHRDLTLANTFKNDRSVQVTNGACTRYFFSISTCSADIVDHTGGKPKPQSLSYLVAFQNMGGTPLIGVRSTEDRAVVSVRAAAVDVLTNRAATLYGVSGFSLLCCLIFLRRLMTGRYAGGRALAAYQ